MQLYIYFKMLKYLYVYMEKLNGKFSWEWMQIGTSAE